MFCKQKPEESTPAKKKWQPHTESSLPPRRSPSLKRSGSFAAMAAVAVLATLTGTTQVKAQLKIVDIGTTPVEVLRPTQTAYRPSLDTLSPTLETNVPLAPVNNAVATRTDDGQPLLTYEQVIAATGRSATVLKNDKTTYVAPENAPHGAEAHVCLYRKTIAYVPKTIPLRSASPYHMHHHGHYGHYGHTTVKVPRTVYIRVCEH